MVRHTLIGMMFVLAAGAAYAQQGVNQPLPKSRIKNGEKSLELYYFMAEADELADAEFDGFTGQVMIGLENRLAINIKGTIGEDDESFIDIEFKSAGISIAYELVEGTGKNVPITIFAGGGMGFLEIGPFDDEDLYIEGGIQLDWDFSPAARLIPFFTWVHHGDDTLDDSVIGAGAKLQVRIGQGWRFSATAVLLEDDIMEGYAVYVGVLGEGL